LGLTLKKREIQGKKQTPSTNPRRGRIVANEKRAIGKNERSIETKKGNEKRERRVRGRGTSGTDYTGKEGGVVSKIRNISNLP